MFFALSKEKIILFSIIAVTVIGVIAWLFWELRPRAGTKVEDLGRGHVPVGTEVAYNSNPPTSGPHYEEWVRKGIYDRPQEDRHLVHSLEHGYIIMSYNCGPIQTGWIKEAFAQEEIASPSAVELKTATEDASASAQMGEEFEADSCKELVESLKSVYEGKGTTKLIVVPRPSLDVKLALTSWMQIQKLDNFDRKAIESFIDSNRNQGPERTMEQ